MPCTRTCTTTRRLLSRQIGETQVSYYSQARLEAQHYSDRLREQGTAECEWHEGQPKRECPECAEAYEEYCEAVADMDREERAWARSE